MHQLCYNFDNEGKEVWQNFIIKTIDYLANPVYRFKHIKPIDTILEFYMTALPFDKGLFNSIQGKIGKLLNECYIEQVDQAGISAAFNKFATNLENKPILIHEAGN